MHQGVRSKQNHSSPLPGPLQDILHCSILFAYGSATARMISKQTVSCLLLGESAGILRVLLPAALPVVPAIKASATVMKLPSMISGGYSETDLFS